MFYRYEAIQCWQNVYPRLDVRDGQVVKGVQFRNHEIIGYTVPLAKRHADSAARTNWCSMTLHRSSSDGRVVDVPGGARCRVRSTHIRLRKAGVIRQRIMTPP